MKIPLSWIRDFAAIPEDLSLEALENAFVNVGFEVEEIPAQDIDQVAVSSTKIRAALRNGDIQTANRYLGYAYPFNGKVIGSPLSTELSNTVPLTSVP